MSRLGFFTKKPWSRSARAGLLFPVGRIHRFCRKDMWPGRKVGKLAPIFMTAVLEYLVAEVLEQAGVLDGFFLNGKVLVLTSTKYQPNQNEQNLLSILLHYKEVTPEIKDLGDRPYFL